MTASLRAQLSLDAIEEAGESGLLLVRHGQTAWNSQRRFLGRSDVPLDETGRSQAEALASWLEPLPLARIVASPLARAWGTAQALARGRGVEPEPVIALAELDQGELEGKPSAALPRDYPEFFQEWVSDPEHARVPGGETLGECRDRAWAALREIASRTEPGQLVALVSHQMVLASLVCTAMELPLPWYRLVRNRNTAVNVLTWRDGRFTVRRLDLGPPDSYSKTSHS